MSNIKCPVCGKGDLLKYKGVPEVLDIVKLTKEHPIPILRSWASEKAENIKKEIESKYYYRKCNKCGFIAFFEET
jgi:ribosomal protein S27E